MLMTCPKCRTEIRDHERICPACSKDLGFPNVRAAKETAEKTALVTRYEHALTEAGLKSSTDVLLRFQSALRFSAAVICRSISKTMQLISSDNELYASFYELVGAGARRPEKSVIERERLLADDLLFPHYKDEIRFAALSSDGMGVTEYGSCSLTLKTLAISDRATVFEENSLEFCRTRGLGVGTPVPPGHRAVWEERELLGCAKLFARMNPSTPDSSFAGILKSGKDFIEVHIYGTLHRGSLERIVLDRPSKGPDRALLSAMKEIVKRDRLSIIVEERT
jgi:hypothetical protein